jgi:hypothetical protein
MSEKNATGDDRHLNMRRLFADVRIGIHLTDKLLLDIREL